jgi:hypothetical protein
MVPMNKRLRGWKEIAAHLTASERTARRWESTRGLPVHRVGGRSRDAVLADAEELDLWIASSKAVVSAAAAGEDCRRGRREAHSVRTLATDFLAPVASLATRGTWRGRGTAFLTTITACALVTLGVRTWAERPLSLLGVGLFGGPTHKSEPPTMVMLRISEVDGRSVKLGIVDGTTGIIREPNQKVLQVRPHIEGTELSLDLSVLDTLTDGETARLRLTHVTQGAVIRIDTPLWLEVEWIRTVRLAPSAGPGR